jgi:hypothetical protein
MVKVSPITNGVVFSTVRAAALSVGTINAQATTANMMCDLIKPILLKCKATRAASSDNDASER